MSGTVTPADAAVAARRVWRLAEPVHAVTYFAPEARAAYEEAGLRGYWRGYFAGRAAPLGPVGPEPVVAAFFGFAPAMVARALPGVWTLAPPERALEARRLGAGAALRRLLAGREAEVAEAVDLLRPVTGGLGVAGRVLAAANLALPSPATRSTPSGTRPLCCGSTAGTAMSRRSSRPAWTGARRWCCARASTCRVRSCSRTAAGATSSGTPPRRVWPPVVCSARTAPRPPRAGRPTARWRRPPTVPPRGLGRRWPRRPSSTWSRCCPRWRGPARGRSRTRTRWVCPQP